METLGAFKAIVNLAMVRDIYGSEIRSLICF
jgi:hypothetical protein